MSLLGLPVREHEVRSLYIFDSLQTFSTFLILVVVFATFCCTKSTFDTARDPLAQGLHRQTGLAQKLTGPSCFDAYLNVV